MNNRNKGLKKEVAILGGAFNPVTMGHIQIARYVLDKGKRFDQVWLMPCYYHVYQKSMVSSEHRLAMCELACEGAGDIVVSDYEIRTESAKGTYHLLRRLLKEEFAREINFSMIIGQDNANTFQHWLHYDKLEKLLPFVVVPRQGVAEEEDVDWYKKTPHLNLKGNSPIMEVSSTLVRQLLKEHKIDALEKYVDTRVLEYIRHKGLYLVS